MEAPTVEVPPQEPKTRPPHRRRLVLMLSALALLLLIGASLDSYLIMPHAQRLHAPTVGGRLMPTATTPAPPRLITEFPLPTQSDPIGIIAGPDGNLWFTEYSSRNKIRAHQPNRADHRVLAPPARQAL